MGLHELGKELQLLDGDRLIEVYDGETDAIDRMPTSTAGQYVEATTIRLEDTMPALVVLAHHIANKHFEETGDQLASEERLAGMMRYALTIHAAIEFDDMSRPIDILE